MAEPEPAPRDGGAQMLDGGVRILSSAMVAGITTWLLTTQVILLRCRGGGTPTEAAAMMVLLLLPVIHGLLFSLPSVSFGSYFRTGFATLVAVAVVLVLNVQTLYERSQVHCEFHTEVPAMVVWNLIVLVGGAALFVLVRRLLRGRPVQERRG